MWKKIWFGILFVAACFASMYVLVQYSENMLYVGGAAAALLITAFLFMNAVFLDKIKKLVPKEEKDEFLTGTGSEFEQKLLKHLQETENTQKELLETLKNQNVLLQAQIDNLEHEIYLLSEKQVNQAKSIIKFNKENARQLAISERETLEHVMLELKKAIEKKGGRAVEEETLEEEVLMEENFREEALFEEAAPVLDTAADVIAEEEIPEMPVLMEEVPEEELPDLEALLAEEPMMEEPKAEEPAADPFAGLSSDPNAMMTPEDIAKLLEAMGQ